MIMNELDYVEIYTSEDALRLIELLIHSESLVMDATASFLMKLLIAEIRRSRGIIQVEENEEDPTLN